MSDKFKKWVIPNSTLNKPGNNYANFKAHKPEKNYPARMISTGCEAFTKNLAILTSYELKKVKLDFCLKDTNHFLQKIDQINKSGIILEADSILMCSFDIVQMFPNITKEIGLPACRKHLDKRDRKIFSSDCIRTCFFLTVGFFRP